MVHPLIEKSKTFIQNFQCHHIFISISLFNIWYDWCILFEQDIIPFAFIQTKLHSSLGSNFIQGYMHIAVRLQMRLLVLEMEMHLLSMINIEQSYSNDQ